MSSFPYSTRCRQRCPGPQKQYRSNSNLIDWYRNHLLALGHSGFEMDSSRSYGCFKEQARTPQAQVHQKYILISSLLMSKSYFCPLYDPSLFVIASGHMTSSEALSNVFSSPPFPAKVWNWHHCFPRPLQCCQERLVYLGRIAGNSDPGC